MICVFVFLYLLIDGKEQQIKVKLSFSLSSHLGDERTLPTDGCVPLLRVPVALLLFYFIFNFPDKQPKLVNSTLKRT